MTIVSQCLTGEVVPAETIAALNVAFQDFVAAKKRYLDMLFDEPSSRLVVVIKSMEVLFEVLGLAELEANFDEIWDTEEEDSSQATLDRWIDELRNLQGSFASESLNKLVQSMVVTLAQISAQTRSMVLPETQLMESLRATYLAIREALAGS